MTKWVYREDKTALEIVDTSMVVGVLERYCGWIKLENKQWLHPIGDGNYYDHNSDLWLDVFQSEHLCNENVDAGEFIGMVKAKNL